MDRKTNTRVLERLLGHAFCIKMFYNESLGYQINLTATGHHQSI